MQSGDVSGRHANRVSRVISRVPLQGYGFPKVFWCGLPPLLQPPPTSSPGISCFSLPCTTQTTAGEERNILTHTFGLNVQSTINPGLHEQSDVSQTGEPIPVISAQEKEPPVFGTCELRDGSNAHEEGPLRPKKWQPTPNFRHHAIC